MNENFSNRLKKAMEIRNIKASELSEKANIPKSAISQYLSGLYEAKQKSIFKIANILSVSEAWLMGLDVPMERNVKIDKLGNPVVSIPILGTVKAGYDYLAQENWIGTVDINKKLSETGEFFALKVKGNSMSPLFLEGDTVILKKQNDCENNEVAVVIINGDEGTLKMVKKTEQGIILQSLNPVYSPTMFTNEEIKSKPVIIAGVFEEMRRDKLKL